MQPELNNQNKNKKNRARKITALECIYGKKTDSNSIEK